MNNLKLFLGILICLSASRFIPHPPNFTNLIALGFYVPAIFGLRYIPLVVIVFAITDLFFGFHQLTIFTWGSVIIVGLISKYLNQTFLKRFCGVLTGCFLFYVITNFGVWLIGNQVLIFETLIITYIKGIPFFGYTLISTIIYSLIIEAIYKTYLNYNKIKI
tara:strand:+ start:1182 stop:1667 length:486 start_codon:yes stop_codon:yes gene_type:complete